MVLFDESEFSLRFRKLHGAFVDKRTPLPREWKILTNKKVIAKINIFRFPKWYRFFSFPCLSTGSQLAFFSLLLWNRVLVFLMKSLKMWFTQLQRQSWVAVRSLHESIEVFERKMQKVYLYLKPGLGLLTKWYYASLLLSL